MHHYDLKSNATENSSAAATASVAGSTPPVMLDISPKQSAIEIMPTNALLKELSMLVISYYNFDCQEIEDVKQDRPICVNPNLTFFGQHILAAGLAAHYILYGNAEDTMRLISASANAAVPVHTRSVPVVSATTASSAGASPVVATAAPSTIKTADILKVIVQAQDPRERRVEGTLLGIAAMANSIDPLPYSDTSLHDRKHHGIVEQIITSNCITEADVKATLREVFPTCSPKEGFIVEEIAEFAGLGPNDIDTKDALKNALWSYRYWQRETDKRMQPLVEAYMEFSQAIINDEIPANDLRCPPVWDESTVFQRFRNRIAIDPKQVIRMGLTMDVWGLASRFLRFSLDNMAAHHFVNDGLDKNALFLVVGFGSMLRLAAVDDAHVITHGMNAVIDYREFPNRCLTMRACFYGVSSNLLPYYASNYLGNSFVLNVGGYQIHFNSRARFDERDIGYYRQVQSNKNNNIEQLTGQQNSSSASPLMAMGMHRAAPAPKGGVARTDSNPTMHLRRK